MTVLRRRIAIVATMLAILGGLASVALAQSEGPIARAARDTGIVVALGGLLTAIGTQVQPALKLYLDSQRLKYDVQEAVKAAAAERHAIMERVKHDEARIDLLYRTLLPDVPIPHPPEFPPEREASSIPGV